MRCQFGQRFTRLCVKLVPQSLVPCQVFQYRCCCNLIPGVGFLQVADQGWQGCIRNALLKVGIVAACQVYEGLGC